MGEREVNSVDWHSYLASILQTVREGILLADYQGNILAVNQELLDSLGENRSDELIGHRMTEEGKEGHTILSRLGYTPTEWEVDCQALIRQEAEFKRKQVFLNPDHPRPVERVTAPVRGTNGQVIGWLFVFHKNTTEVEQAQVSDDMLQMLVHDLRSPLAVIMGSLGTLKMLLSEGSWEHSGQLIELMLRSSDRILRLINDLLYIGRIEDGDSFLSPEPVEIASLMEEAARQIAPIAGEARITIEVQPGRDLPLIMLDPTHISRVLVNLLDNAVRFTPDGGRIALWSRLNADTHPARVEIGVTDNGAGIPVDMRERLFVKFQHMAAMPGRRSGTGLGLHYCKLVVEAHGGEIGVQSQVGIGSTFTISFPIEG